MLARKVAFKFKPATRLGETPEYEGGLDTIHPYPKARKPGLFLHPCKEFSDMSWRSNVGAQKLEMPLNI